MAPRKLITNAQPAKSSRKRTPKDAPATDTRPKATFRKTAVFAASASASPYPAPATASQSEGRPATPPNSLRTNVKGNRNIKTTPTMSRTSYAGPYTSTHYVRDERVRALAFEMEDKFLGPMEPPKFLDRYLAEVSPPISWDDPRVAASLDALREVPSATTEENMYNPLISALNDFCPGMEIVNTSQHADTTNASVIEDIKVKPDLTVYKVEDIEMLRRNRMAEDIEKLQAGERKTEPRDFPVVTDMSWAQTHFEVKLSGRDDPFRDNADTFLHPSDDATDTRGQIISYAIAQLAHQYRTHLFTVFIGKRWARLIRWDRSGAVVTERFDITVDAGARLLAEFFWRFSHASDADRGIDATVQRFHRICYVSEALQEKEKEGANDDKKSPAKACYKVEPATVPVEDEHVKKAREILGLDTNDDVWRFSVYNDEAIHAMPLYVYGGTPFFRGRGSLTGRCTRVIRVWDPANNRIVLLKDTWRITGADMVKEGETYRQLHSNGVKHIPVCYEAGDIPLLHHHTVAHEIEFRGEEEPAQIRQHQHYRLLLQNVGRDLRSFKNTRELVVAMRDALIAHWLAYDQAKILHRDISVGNILIGHAGGGFLIDWDLSKPLHLLGEIARQPERTGTWQFIAARLIGELEPPEQEDSKLKLLAVGKWEGLEKLEEVEDLEELEELENPHESEESKRPEESTNSDAIAPTLADDLESFFHVLCWMTLRFTEHKLNGEKLAIIMQQVYDFAAANSAAPGGVEGFYNKETFITKRYMSSRAGLPPTALRSLLSTLEEVFSVRYELRRPKEEELDQCRAAYRDASEEERKRKEEEDIKTRYMLRLDSLDSKWMIMCFTGAIKSSKQWPQAHIKPIEHAIIYPPSRNPQKRKNKGDTALSSAAKKLRTK